MVFISEETVNLAVDVAIRYRGGVVLVERLTEPIGSALPGQKVKPGQTLEAAVRECGLLETGLRISRLIQLGPFDTVGRDKRGPVISIAYSAEGSGQLGVAASKVASIGRAYLVPIADLDDVINGLQFDHAEIVVKALEAIKEGKPVPQYGQGTKAGPQRDSLYLVLWEPDDKPNAKGRTIFNQYKTCTSLEAAVKMISKEDIYDKFPMLVARVPILEEDMPFISGTGLVLAPFFPDKYGHSDMGGDWNYNPLYEVQTNVPEADLADAIKAIRSEKKSPSRMFIGRELDIYQLDANAVIQGT